MQQRFHISYHPDFESALAAKKDLESKRPNDYFQIRKRRNNFDLVGRVTITEAQTFPRNNPQLYSKKKRSRKAWKKTTAAPKFEIEYNNQKARDNGTGKWSYLSELKDKLRHYE